MSTCLRFFVETFELFHVLFVQEAESAVAASHRAAEEVKEVKTRIEASLESSGRGERDGPVYYGMDSTARRSSHDVGGHKTSIVNDDLADEIEAIRLAADFSSRRMLNEQRKDSTGGSSASSSRLRIRALLDKQTKQRVGVKFLKSWYA